jgi:ATP-dependent exoDNAse (exonuclease V) alpha subunit
MPAGRADGAVGAGIKEPSPVACGSRRAAHRRRPATAGRICADPIHAGFRHKEDHMLECDMLVVDETSMIDVPLMHALLKAVPDHAALILVSEIDQLPPVGPGQVVADIIGADAVPVVRLTEVFR